MLIVAVYRSDSIMPISIHLCNEAEEFENELRLHYDDTVTTIKDYSYYLINDSEDVADEETLVKLFKKFEKDFNALNNEHEQYIFNHNHHIVCLCGSTKFKTAFEEANKVESLKGNIVLTVAMFGHIEGLNMEGEEKKIFDNLHFKKIELADEIFVLNVGGYIGESTRREIDYALSLNKKIRYLEGEYSANSL